MKNFILIFLVLFLMKPAFADRGATSENFFRKLPSRHERLAPDQLPGFRSEKTVVLYDDIGVWDDGREHLKLFLAQYGWSYRTLSAKDLLAGGLQGVSLLIMPGGESWKYLESLGPAGAEIIRKYVQQGGRYIGICAGAFFATSHREGGYATGPYGIGLLQGIAYDGTALGTDPFKEGMLDFDLFFEGFASVFRIVLFGGPSFRFDATEAQQKSLEVLARFQKIHEPTMILFRYGQGRVFLSGPHLEIEEDKTDWGSEYTDPDSEWPLLNRVVERLIN